MSGCWTRMRGKRGTAGFVSITVVRESMRCDCRAEWFSVLWNLESCHPCGCDSDTYHLPQQCCRPWTPFHGNSIPWLLRPLSAGWWITKQKCFRMVWGAQQEVWGVDLASKFPRSQSNRESVGCVGQIHGSTSQITGLTLSAADILVPDTSSLVSRVGLVESMPWRVRTVWAAKGEQHNIRSVVIMFCLITKITQAWNNLWIQIWWFLELPPCCLSSSDPVCHSAALARPASNSDRGQSIKN